MLLATVWITGKPAQMTLCVHNQGDHPEDPDFGNYKVWFQDSEDVVAYVDDFPRRAGAWALVAEALKALEDAKDQEDHDEAESGQSVLQDHQSTGPDVS